MILDIFSRYILGWRVGTVEDGRLATDLVAAIITEQHTTPGYLHADRGAAMISQPLASLLVDLDVTRSHDRPRTRNDNPFSESQFKTTKYVPDYPSGSAPSPTPGHRWASSCRGTTSLGRGPRGPPRTPHPPTHSSRLPERVTINDPTERAQQLEPQKA